MSVAMVMCKWAWLPPACGLLLCAAYAAGDEHAAADPKAPLTQEDFVAIRGQLEALDDPWRQLHWHTSLTEARRKAQREKKPLLIRCSWGSMHGVC